MCGLGQARVRACARRATCGPAHLNLKGMISARSPCQSDAEDHRL